MFGLSVRMREHECLGLAWEGGRGSLLHETTSKGNELRRRSAVVVAGRGGGGGREEISTAQRVKGSRASLVA